MNDSLKLSIGRLKVLQKELKEKALSEVLEPRVRAAYAEAAGKLGTAVGELDYLVSLKDRE